MSVQTQRSFDRDLLRVALAASGVSVLSFLTYFQRGEILLYGDAVAHINIARRVFDSQTPGLLQLGTVWLPLPHLLMIPFLLSKWIWQSGVGGSIPSMIAYVFGVLGVFRLTRGVLDQNACTKPAPRAGAWIAALVFGANPNLIYMQATAMTESLYLALFLWAAAYFAEFLRATKQEESDSRSKLTRCALCLAGAELTRYDGWFLAAAIGSILVVLLFRRWEDRTFRRTALKFLVGIAVAPALWLVYNAAVYGNALEFANGPYSARAIERRTSVPGAPSHPGTGNVVTAASYILKSGELNMADGKWGRIWVAVMLGGLMVAFMGLRARGVLLLWIPLVFYALSIAYGGVPLFLPAWWPFTWYNLRYGLQLLPLFAVSAGLIVAAAAEWAAPKGVLEKWRLAASLKRCPDTNLQSLVKHAPHPDTNLQRPPTHSPHPDSSAQPGPSFQWLAVCTVMVAVVAVSYFSIWRAQPLCFKEAWVNSRTKLALESAVARSLSNFPRDANYLMYLGEHVGVFQQAGVPLRQVVNEGNHRPWRKPLDQDGLWERALTDPAQYVDFVIAYEGDAVDRAVNKSDLTLVSEIHTSGQARARIYATRPALNQPR